MSTDADADVNNQELLLSLKIYAKGLGVVSERILNILESGSTEEKNSVLDALETALEMLRQAPVSSTGRHRVVNQFLKATNIAVDQIPDINAP